MAVDFCLLQLTAYADINLSVFRSASFAVEQSYGQKSHNFRAYMH
ncbi:Uncharacterised protein [uncultured archaeon]|nr:Uncharacterised protein [uncultured archaeon]